MGMCKLSISLAVLCLMMVGFFSAHAQSVSSQDYVDAHNAARSEVGVGPVSWDDELAALAQEWADNCVFEHGNPPNNYPTYIGQNLYASSSNDSATTVVQAWVKEKASYHYEDNSCDDVCGHYTQVVWRNSTLIGCAISPALCYQGMTIFVCNYAPGGNIGDEKPY